MTENESSGILYSIRCVRRKRPQGAEASGLVDKELAVPHKPGKRCFMLCQEGAECPKGCFAPFYYGLKESNMEIQAVLQQVQAGTMTVAEAEGLLHRQPFEEYGFAKLDTGRAARTGFAEVVFCAGKPDAMLQSIYCRLYEAEGEVFGTRATPHQYEVVKQVLPQIQYDPISRILKLEKPEKPRTGHVVVCTAGTADIPVAEEAAQTAEYFGCKVTRVYDVGVSGLHRLLARLEVIQSANCVVAVAGMEGALASVLGGMVQNPVIAVPTSVGYGASMNGLSALLTMINSCANGIATVNIDNGYGAGYLATQMNRLAARGEVQ